MMTPAKASMNSKSSAFPKGIGLRVTTGDRCKGQESNDAVEMEFHIRDSGSLFRLQVETMASYAGKVYRAAVSFMSPYRHRLSSWPCCVLRLSGQPFCSSIESRASIVLPGWLLSYFFVKEVIAGAPARIFASATPDPPEPPAGSVRKGIMCLS